MSAFRLWDIAIGGFQILKRVVQVDAAWRLDHERLFGRLQIVLVDVVHAEMHADDAMDAVFIAVRHAKGVAVIIGEDVDGRTAPFIDAVGDALAFAVNLLNLLHRIAEADAAERHLRVGKPCGSADGGGKQEEREEQREYGSDFHGEASFLDRQNETGAGIR